MTNMSRMSVLSVGIAAALFAGTAMAHPKLVATSPAADATVPPVAAVELHFSEKLVPAFSGIDLVMTDMPGMRMAQPMKMPVKSSVARDGMTLIGTLPKALPAGSYKLGYHVVAADTHRVEGGYAFKVK